MLTIKQEKYVQNIIKGMSQRQAYRDVYPKSKKWKDSAVDSQASKLLKTPKVFQRYNELLKKTEDKAIMTAKERMEFLTRVVSGTEKNKTHDSDGNLVETEAYISDKLKSIDLLNKMDGQYVIKAETTSKVEVNPYSKLTTEELRELANK